jgi:transcriptional regulator with XRE-family HTH domain
MGRTPRKLPEAVEFGRRIRARREKLGWSQMALAEEVGLHFTYISSVERGERNISLQNIVRLAVALKVDAATLVKGLGELRRSAPRT